MKKVLLGVSIIAVLMIALAFTGGERVQATEKAVIIQDIDLDENNKPVEYRYYAMCDVEGCHYIKTSVCMTMNPYTIFWCPDHGWRNIRDLIQWRAKCDDWDE